MGKTNKEWHSQNRMPKIPTRDQRIERHVEHAKNCACRKIPKTLAGEVQKLRKIEIRNMEKRDREGYLKLPQKRSELLLFEDIVSGHSRSS
jgi:hypothetical protein